MEVLLCVRVCAMGPLCDREDGSSRRQSLCRRRQTSGAGRPSGPGCRHAETGRDQYSRYVLNNFGFFMAMPCAVCITRWCFLQRPLCLTNKVVCC